MPRHLARSGIARKCRIDFMFSPFKAPFSVRLQNHQCPAIMEPGNVLVDPPLGDPAGFLVAVLERSQTGFKSTVVRTSHAECLMRYSRLRIYALS